MLEICARERVFFWKILEFQKNQTKIFSISHQTVRTVAAQSAKFSFLHYSSSSSSSYTTMSGIDCTNDSTQSVLLNIAYYRDTRQVRPCEECAQFSDGLRGIVPQFVEAIFLPIFGEQFTAEQFFNVRTRTGKESKMKGLV